MVIVVAWAGEIICRVGRVIGMVSVLLYWRPVISDTVVFGAVGRVVAVAQVARSWMFGQVAMRERHLVRGWLQDIRGIMLH